MSLSLSYLKEGTGGVLTNGGGPAAPPPPSGRRNKYAGGDTAAFEGRAFTLDEDGLVLFQSSSRLGVRREGSSGMDDRDKRIYNSLGDTSGDKGKVRECNCAQSLQEITASRDFCNLWFAVMILCMLYGVDFLHDRSTASHHL